jgi:adenylate cyclase
MRDNEEATVRDLAAHRVLITEIIKQHNGRVIDSPGDNILAEFASVVDAVNGAIKIQDEIRKSNTDNPKDRRMEFRIGINLGDVIEEEERIYGDGVNISARVEGLAAGGGIAISGTVYEHIKEKLSLGYHYLGEQNVKNISEPVRVYRLLTEPENAGKMIGEEKSKSKKWPWAAASAIFIFLIIFSGLYWKYYHLPSPVEIDPEGKMTFNLSQGPSIAVLPFVNLSGDPEQDFFCDGITDNITSALAHVRQLFVIARNSTFSYKGKSVNVQQIGDELGVQYLIEGSIQKSENTIRITVQLVETISGNHIWSEIYDRKMEDIFKLQDEITLEILKAIGVSLSDGQQIRKMYEGITDLQILIKFLKAWKYFHRFNKDGNDLARKEIEEIMELDDKISFAYTFLGFIYLHDIYYGACNSSIVCFGQATEAARKALSLDENNHKAHQLTGYIFLMRKEYENAIDEIKRSIDLNPNCADCYLVLGQTYWSSDRPHDALGYIKKAFLLNPKPPSNYYNDLGFTYFFTKEYENAMVAFKKAIAIEPNDFFSHLGLAAVYATLGREKEAKTEGLEVLKIDPTFSIKRFAKIVPLKNSAEINRLAEVLRIAGLK